jgi:membrane-associated HD superfamily phosphohydrolase
VRAVVDWYDAVDEGEEVEARRYKLCPRLTAVQLEALWQLRVIVRDGYLISKTARDQLVDLGLAERLNGWQFITRAGMAVLDVYGLLKDDRYGTMGAAGAWLWTLKPAQFARLRGEGLVTL